MDLLILYLKINNQSVNINLADVIHAISHFNTDEELLNGDYSVFPNHSINLNNMPDLIGSTSNPIGNISRWIDRSVMQARISIFCCS